MNGTQKLLLGLLAMTMLFTMALLPAALADDWNGDGSGYYTVYTPEGAQLFRHGGPVTVGDEYISSDNVRYRVTSVDIAAMKGVAAAVEQLTAQGSFRLLPLSQSQPRVAIYCTHTDESYVPTDGTESRENGGGIVDVAYSLGSSLEALGVEVKVDETNHVPHDAGAYRRSRQTAVELMETVYPDLLLDIHRDAVPPEEYETEVDGQSITAVRIVVGRGNQNRDANEGFAWTVKSIADEIKPGLVKDIYIGKGSYNQDLMPQALLLEFGAHTTDKEGALEATAMMAEVLTQALGHTPAATEAPAGTAAPETTGSAGNRPAATTAPRGQQQSAEKETAASGAGKAIWWIVAGLLGVGVITLLFFNRNGSVGKFFRELTGIGKKPSGK